MKHIEDKNRTSTQAGFTLIEVLISMVILTVALLGMAALMTTNSKSIERSKNLTVASNLALEKIEDLKRIAFNNFNDVNVSDAVLLSDPVTRANPDQVENYGAILNYALFRREVFITDGATPVVSKDIAVVVVWTDISGAHSTLMRTTIAK